MKNYFINNNFEKTSDYYIKNNIIIYVTDSDNKGNVIISETKNMTKNIYNTKNFYTIIITSNPDKFIILTKEEYKKITNYDVISINGQKKYMCEYYIFPSINDENIETVIVKNINSDEFIQTVILDKLSIECILNENINSLIERTQ